MTAQIPDRFIFENKAYGLVGRSDAEPLDIGIAKHRLSYTSSTACHRAYIADFTIHNNFLCVKELLINLDVLPPDGMRRRPKYGGVKPIVLSNSDDVEGVGKRGFNTVYRDVYKKLDYTGGLLIADGYLRDKYRLFGCAQCWHYETVKEILFENGRLENVVDISDRMPALRACAKEVGMGYHILSKDLDEFDFSAYSFRYKNFAPMFYNPTKYVPTLMTRLKGLF